MAEDETFADTLVGAHCVACRPGAPVLKDPELQQFLQQYPDWQMQPVEGVPQLRRVFKFKTYAQALDFTNRLAALAESEGHHPAILLEWGRVTVRWWTHAIHNLHHNDILMAAKTDQLYQH